MAVENVPARFCAPTALTGTEATLYTAATGSGIEAVIRNIHVVNTAGADRTLNLSIGAFAAGTALLYALNVVDALSLDVYIGLNSAETLRGYVANSTAGLTITVMGVT